MEFIKLCNIKKTYHMGSIDVPVLKGVSLTIKRGEFVALMGASGSGKTTLMNILGCLDRPSSGEYWLDGEEVSKYSADERALVRNRKLGFVFQSFNLLPRTSARDNVAMPLSYTAGGLTEREAHERAAKMLEVMGLAERMDHEPSQLSGGQQQRVAIARSLVNNPPVLFADEPTGNLDSQTSDEVLAVFRRLNQEYGITIILVTHEADVAQAADRIIRIRDGLIVDGAGSGVCDMEVKERTEVESAHGRTMKFHRIVRTALKALRRNPMRAMLTTLGIVIGIAAVIAMMEIGQGSSASLQKSIATMGANVLLIMPGSASSSGVSQGAGSVATMTPQDSEALSKGCPSLKAVAPIVRARTQVIYGNRNWVPNQMIGTTSAFLSIREWQKLDQGQTFSDRDVLSVNRVCLIGQTIARELFQGESPIGKEVRVNSVPLRVVGVLARKGANMMGMDQDDILIAPWTVVKYRIAGSMLGMSNQSASSGSSSNSLNSIFPAEQTVLYPEKSETQTENSPMLVRFTSVDSLMAAAKSSEQIQSAIKEMRTVLRKQHGLKSADSDDFDIRDMAEMTNTLSSTTKLMTNLLLCVALISLVVGGVGIMNIMLVSVTERTREIGLRMAIGARGADILWQFMVEAVLLCLVGGAMGIALGHGGSKLVQALLNWPVETSPAAIVAAVTVSATVGIVFGFYPAWKASRLDPIEALRYE